MFTKGAVVGRNYIKKDGFFTCFSTQVKKMTFLGYQRCFLESKKGSTSVGILMSKWKFMIINQIYFIKMSIPGETSLLLGMFLIFNGNLSWWVKLNFLCNSLPLFAVCQNTDGWNFILCHFMLLFSSIVVCCLFFSQHLPF